MNGMNYVVLSAPKIKTTTTTTIITTNDDDYYNEF